MHEQSESVEEDGKHFNVVGRHVRRQGAAKPGSRLKPLFSYEKDDYESDEEATLANQRRSQDFGKEVERSMSRHGAFERLMKELRGH